MISIYTDGSYQTKTKRSGWGFCVVKDNEIVFEKCGWVSDKFTGSRNVTGEIQAAIEAVKWVVENKIRKVKIYYDYIGIAHWALGEWRAKKPVAQRYVEFIKPYINRLEFQHIKGHSGNKYNERADYLAEKGKSGDKSIIYNR